MAHGLAEQARAGAGSGRLWPSGARGQPQSCSWSNFCFCFFRGRNIWSRFRQNASKKKFFWGEPRFFLALQHFLKGGTVVVAGHGGMGSKPRPDWRLSKASSNCWDQKEFRKKKRMVGILEQ